MIVKKILYTYPLHHVMLLSTLFFLTMYTANCQSCERKLTVWGLLISRINTATLYVEDKTTGYKCDLSVDTLTGAETILFSKTDPSKPTLNLDSGKKVPFNYTRFDGSELQKEALLSIARKKMKGFLIENGIYTD